MPAVSNTSPLIALAVAECLDVLPALFQTVLVPEVVVAELRLETSAPGTSALRRVLRAGWLVVRDPTEASLHQVWDDKLHTGETAAIALALEVQPPVVLLDELAARRAAVRRGLVPTGALGVLLAARQRRLVPEIAPLIAVMRRDGAFRASDWLIRDVLRAAGELD